MHHTRTAFTLVEVLVITAAVALVLAALLPAVSNVRQNMQQSACAANLRQITLAGLTFLGDHNNRVQPASAHHWAQAYDPSQRLWSYDRDGRLNDWASALLPYLGDFTGETFRTRPTQARPDFQCPRDPMLALPAAGHALLLSDAFGRQPSPVSFGVNYDIAGLLRDPDDPDAGGAFDYPSAAASAIRVHGNGRDRHTPLETELADVPRPAQTMLYAEAGNAPGKPGPRAAALLRSNALYYSTHTGSTPARGSLAHVADHPSRIGDRIPLDRHRQSINIAFVDGHVATVARHDFETVRVAPTEP